MSETACSPAAIIPVTTPTRFRNGSMGSPSFAFVKVELMSLKVAADDVLAMAVARLLLYRVMFSELLITLIGWPWSANGLFLPTVY